MAKFSRRKFLADSAAVAALAAAPGGFIRAAAPRPGFKSSRILVGSDTPNGILSFAWDAETGTLKPEPIAAKIDQSTWIELSPDGRFLYVASEVNEYEGQPTGAVASYALSDGKLTPISIVPSQGKGTCHLTTDRTGKVILCANYAGGSAASFLSDNGKLSHAVWSEHYKGYPSHGPVADRQEAAHAHFACVSPDNRFVYINDLGADKIHIYKLDHGTGKLISAGEYDADPGSGPRTLHFLAGYGPRSGQIAYSVNELNSTVDVLSWSSATGGLHRVQQVELLPKGTSGLSRACDTVLTRDGRFAYFANRDHDFIMTFTIDPRTGWLTAMEGDPRIDPGGKIPRNFRLDPTERWMLVANQNSNNISVFARDPKTGVLAREGAHFPAATPMCIVFL